MTAPERLRIIFMGTPAFAVPVLSALADAGHEVVGVYTQPDRRTGRGKRVTPSPVKAFAAEQGLPVFQPASLRRDEGARQELSSLSPDIIVVAAYGLYLPTETLEAPRLGCLNVHPSLLPKYRGASPVSSAILSGDDVTGVTLIELVEEMDAGPIVAQRKTAIAPTETTENLTPRLFEMGATLLTEVLPQWTRGEILAQPQEHTEATLTSRLSKDDGEIDWNDSAVHIARQVRAYNSWPGTSTRWQGKVLKIIESSVKEVLDDHTALPGQVVALDGGFIGIGTGEGTLAVSRLQLEGRRAVDAAEFLRGYSDFAGSQVGS